MTPGRHSELVHQVQRLLHRLLGAPSDLVSYRANSTLITESGRTRLYDEPSGGKARRKPLLDGNVSFEGKDQFGAVFAVNVVEFDPFEPPQHDEGEAQRREPKPDLATAKT